MCLLTRGGEVLLVTVVMCVVVTWSQGVGGFGQGCRKQS